MGRPKTIEDDELLGIARRIFREHGHTATTQQVAKAAGISEAILYKRFHSKDALFIAALSAHTASLAGLSAIDPSVHTPRSYLAAAAVWIKGHFRGSIPSILSIAAHPKYGRDMMDRIHQHNRAGEISAILQMRIQHWQQTGEIGPVNAMHFAHVFLHALHTMALVEVLSRDDPQLSAPENMTAFVDVFWNGLKPDK